MISVNMFFGKYTFPRNLQANSTFFLEWAYVCTIIMDTKKAASRPCLIRNACCFLSPATGLPVRQTKPAVADYFPWCSSDTVNFLRPCARREANTRRPFFVAIRSRKPCLFTRRRLCGWNVLFIVLLFFICWYSRFWVAKLLIIFEISKDSYDFSPNIYVFFRLWRNIEPL